MRVTKLSLLFSAVFAEDSIAVDQSGPGAVDKEFIDDDDFDSFPEEDGEFGGEDGASLDSLLETLKGPNNENSENIDKLKELLASGDESEESMAKLQALFDQILGGQAGDLSFDEDDEL